MNQIICPQCGKEATKVTTDQGIYYYICQDCKLKTITPDQKEKLQELRKHDPVNR